MKPITPAEASKNKITIFPDEVIAAFNTCIMREWDGSRAEVKQKMVIAEIISQFAKNERELKRAEIFANKWLDVEEVYRQEGWKVEYDKPGYCESYDAFFVFTKKS